MALRADIVGKEFCEVLGIDYKSVFRLVIDCKTGDAAKIKIWSWLQESENIKAILKTYKLDKA